MLTRDKNTVAQEWIRPQGECAGLRSSWLAGRAVFARERQRDGQGVNIMPLLQGVLRVAR